MCTRDGVNTQILYSNMNMNTLNFQEYDYKYGYKITVFPWIGTLYKGIHECIHEYIFLQYGVSLIVARGLNFLNIYN